MKVVQYVYQEQRLADLEVTLEPKATLAVDDHTARCAASTTGGRRRRSVVAAQVGATEVTLVVARDEEKRHHLTVSAGEQITALALGGTRSLAIGTSQGRVIAGPPQDPPRLSNVSPRERMPRGWAIDA
jgi:hypothetical protein